MGRNFKRPLATFQAPSNPSLAQRCLCEGKKKRSFFSLESLQSLDNDRESSPSRGLALGPGLGSHLPPALGTEVQRGLPARGDVLMQLPGFADTPGGWAATPIKAGKTPTEVGFPAPLITPPPNR